MPVTIIDETIIDAIAGGNAAPLADALRSRNASGTEIWTTAETARHINGPLGTAAQRQVLTDFRVRSPVNDAYAENVVMQGRVNNLPVHTRATGALALHLGEQMRTNPEVMTTNQAFQATWRRYFGNVAPEMARHNPQNPQGGANGGAAGPRVTGA